MRLGIMTVTRAAAIFLACGLTPAVAQDLKGHGGPIRAITISADGTHALTASFDYSAIFWNLEGKEPSIGRRLLGHDAAVNAAAFTSDGRRAVTASDDGTVALWDLGTGAMVHRFAGHNAKVVGVAVSPDGKWAASAGWDGKVRIWDIVEMVPGRVLQGHTGNVNAVLFTPDGESLVSAGYDGTIRAWPMNGGDPRVLVRHGWGINTMRLLPGDRLLFGALNGGVGVIDAREGDMVREFDPYEGPVLTSAVSRDGTIMLAGGADGRIRIWRIDGWKQIHVHVNPYGPVWAAALSADNRAVYYAGLDDFAIHLRIDPLASFEPAKGTYPRRFQVTDDMELGERMFAGRCSVCHTLTPDGANRAGPTLHRLFGRKAGTLPGYPYSDALKNSDIVWNEQTIGRLFEIGPQHLTPGTKMPLQSISNPVEREALIAYLKNNTGGPGDGAAVRNQ